MWTVEFWKAAAERAVKTFAQTLLVLLGGGTTALNLIGVDWQGALLAAGSAAALSVLTSVISARVGPSGTPSLVAIAPAVVVSTPPAGRHEK